ncbi:MAG: histidine phosphatase family protein [Clostridia bacterium]|nr:histidine phosphatase family protein [Clostridia bacterium]
MQRIILVRHGDTAWNREHVFRGRVEVPLSDEGREQARLAGLALKDAPLSRIYCSPRQRAKETAQLIAQFHDQEVIPHDAFDDMDFGQWQGMPLEQVKSQYAEDYAAWESKPEAFVAPGGEGLDGVRQRSLAGLQQLVSEMREGETLAIVTHRVILKVLICAMLGLDNSHFWHIRQGTCAINIFDYDRARRLFIAETINDTCHLRSLEPGSRLDF